MNNDTSIFALIVFYAGKWRHEMTGSAAACNEFKNLHFGRTKAKVIYEFNLHKYV